MRPPQILEHSVPAFRLGIDLGGTKIEGLVLDADNQVVAGPIRVATPANDYDGTVTAIAGIVAQLEQDLSITEHAATQVGIGMPGSIARATGLVQNANSTWLNGQPLREDLSEKIGQPVQLANDANCFALSEATDGAGAGERSVFGVILGTGCGGGLVIDRHLIDGPMGIAGEWGHNPLPWAVENESPGPLCWCGRLGCLESWVSGPALEAQYYAATSINLKVSEVAALSDAGDVAARDTILRHTDRLARGLAHVINIFDPDVVVLGGGLSKLDHLYRELPDAIAPHLFTDHPAISIRRPRWGDASGVRGAARLTGP
jgi:fructokinase